MASEQRAASLLSLIASKALVSGGFSGAPSGRESRSGADIDEQRAQTMMYAARMTYLQDSDQVKPDTMFMTRKQAQKLAQQDSTTTMSLKKLDVGGKNANGAGGGDTKGGGGAAAANASPNWKKQRGLALLDDRQQTWMPVTQAGCHFWQSQETGECRSVAPAGWEGRSHPALDGQCDSDGEEGDDPPFPDSFAFLTDKQRPSL